MTVITIVVACLYAVFVEWRMELLERRLDKLVRYINSVTH